MRVYNTIIFDVDGTLINTETAVLHSLQKMLKADYDRDVAAEDLTFVLGVPGTTSLPQLGIKDIGAANERWNYFMKEFYSTIDVFAGIRELLETLQSKGIKQGIVTSKTLEELRDDFTPFGLMPYLPYVVCADDTEKHKPNPEPLLHFMKVSGVDPARSIYIGDTIYDYECARDAGVDFGLALWGCKDHEQIPAQYKLKSPLDLLNLVIA
ncbi:HAD family hydrolase [Paenibacillus sp. MMS18-CY102]|uniref:HAD family hydrolase n=1 Tax=Paenibacillus sp. MMS18-CY102 TaxID=2682849 RepID=UPI0013665BDB|nr:HAD family hydrolase [Paenibacillus sp. MMS18-CY102]MWC29814.1 HAD-IA family hydrolase [Paenibacillus sp. MMS18-CY102]